VNARRLVAESPLLELLEAFAATTPFGFACDDAGLRVVCPSCRFTDHNGPTAVVVNARRISCHRCRRAFTRAAFEHLVLTDPDRLDALVGAYDRPD
jgi:hypothetical protein